MPQERLEIEAQGSTATTQPEVLAFVTMLVVLQELAVPQKLSVLIVK